MRVGDVSHQAPWGRCAVRKPANTSARHVERREAFQFESVLRLTTWEVTPCGRGLTPSRGRRGTGMELDDDVVLAAIQQRGGVFPVTAKDLLYREQRARIFRATEDTRCRLMRCKWSRGRSTVSKRRDSSSGRAARRVDASHTPDASIYAKPDESRSGKGASYVNTLTPPGPTSNPTIIKTTP